jgi:hypothetical protein
MQPLSSTTCWLAAASGSGPHASATSQRSPASPACRDACALTAAGAQSTDVWVIGDKPVEISTLLPAADHVKILRVLGNLLNLPGFDADAAEQIRDQVLAQDVAGRLSNAAPADLASAAYRPSLEQVALNLRSTGRTSPDGLVHVRLRRVDSVEPGLSRPVVLAEATVGLHGEGVTVLP